MMGYFLTLVTGTAIGYLLCALLTANGRSE